VDSGSAHAAAQEVVRSGRPPEPCGASPAESGRELPEAGRPAAAAGCCGCRLSEAMLLAVDKKGKHGPSDRASCPPKPEYERDPFVPGGESRPRPEKACPGPGGPGRVGLQPDQPVGPPCPFIGKPWIAPDREPNARADRLGYRAGPRPTCRTSKPLPARYTIWFKPVMTCNPCWQAFFKVWESRC
jgi:hypothetical protein